MERVKLRVGGGVDEAGLLLGVTWGNHSFSIISTWSRVLRYFSLQEHIRQEKVRDG